VRMSPDHLERAARMVCSERGLDPEEVVLYGTEPVADLVSVVSGGLPRWKKVAMEVEATFQVVWCIGETARVKR